MALAPSGGSGESQLCWAAMVRSAGSSASAPPPAPCPSSTETDGESSPMSSCSDRAISPARPPSSASWDRAAPAVSMTVSSGSRSSSASFMPRRASRSEPGPIPAASLRSGPGVAQDHAGLPAEAGQGQQQPGILFALAGAVERQRVAGAVCEQLAQVRPARVAGRCRWTSRRPRRRDGRRGWPVAGDRRPAGFADQDAQGPVDDVGSLPGRHHGVDQALVEQVLGHLDVRPGRPRRRGPRRRAGPRNPSSAPGFRHGDVAQRSPGGHDSSRGGVPQVDQVGQPGLAVGADGAR